MLGERRACLLLSLLLLSQLCSPTESVSQVIELSPDCDDALIGNRSCLSLNTVLSNLTSNVTLQLQPGVHVITSYIWVTNKTDLSIIGDTQDPSRVVIECGPSLGLIFMNIKRLIFRGLTIQDCGFNGTENVDSTFDYVRRSTILFYKPLPDFSTGVFVANVEDLVMERAAIKGNKGFGIVGINIVGQSRISTVNFTRNYPEKCVLQSNSTEADYGGSGGAMFLLYQDYNETFPTTRDLDDTSTMLIANVNVHKNYNCRVDLLSVRYNLLSRSLGTHLVQNYYSFVGSGGITISLAQSSYALHVNITDSSFTHNVGTYHGSALEVSHSELTTDSHIYITNSCFHGNGKVQNISDGPLSEHSDPIDIPGGALVASFYLPVPPSFFQDVLTKIISQQKSSVQVQNCTFMDNVALSGSSIFVFSLGPTVSGNSDALVIQNCRFERNLGDYGSAIYLTEISYSAFEPGLQVTFDSITAIHNGRLHAAMIQSGTTGVIDINFINVTLMGTNLISKNNDTAISVYSGILVISGFTTFSENIGVSGGALNLNTESYLVLTGAETNVHFIKNRAQVNGGGIFVDLNTIRASHYDCFLFIEDVHIFCSQRGGCPKPNGRYSLTFESNEAEFGTAIYGSSLSSCPWNSDDEGISYLSVNNAVTDVSNSTLPIFILPAFNDRTINTEAKAIWANYNNTILQEDNSIHVYPGQQFEIFLGSFDSLNHSVPLTVLSQLLNVPREVNAHSLIGGSDRYLLAGGNNPYTSVPCHVFAEENTEYKMIISSDQVVLDNFTLTVFLSSCPDGFSFNKISHGCECDIHPHLEHVSCNLNGTISYREGYWIGIDSDTPSYNESDHIVIQYLQEQCIFDYCAPDQFIVNLSEPDSQCRNHRSGALCGGCAANYSRLIGTSACGICDSYLSLLWILLFAVLGILLFGYFALLNVSVTDGFINGFIFFSNIANVFITFYTPRPPGSPRAVPEVIIGFINLEFGIEICFYPNMTDLDLAGLRLVFPLYLMFLLLIVYLCGKYISNQRVANLFQTINVAKVFATLLLLSYTSWIQTCFSILKYLWIDDALVQLRWGIDPNVPYNDPIHIILTVIAVCFLLFLIPIPFLLMFPMIIFRSKYLRNSKPIIDAFIAPFARGREFWIGLRLIFRIVFYLIALTVVNTIELAILTILVAVLTVAETAVQPFASKAGNLLSRILMISLTIFAITSTYSHLNRLLTDDPDVELSVFYLYLFLVLFLFLNIHYLLIRFECTRIRYYHIIELLQQKLNQLKGRITTSESKKKPITRKKPESKKENSISHTSVSFNSLRYNTLNFNEAGFSETDYIAYREELLEGEEPLESNSVDRYTKKQNVTL